MKSSIEAIRTAILTDSLNMPTDECFAGADLIVSSTPVPTEAGKTIVVTEHAPALSSLILQLKNACSDWLDYLNKYEFYAALGKAANAYLANSSDLKGLQLHVVDTALEMEDHYNRFLYFAYGSNMDEKQMALRCPDAKMIDVITVPGWRFALDIKGVATILPDENQFVTGLLWSVTPEDIQRLDRFEGVKIGCYRKETLPIDLYSKGQTALVYLSNREFSPQGHREGYMVRIVQAAIDHDFPKEYIQTLIEFLSDMEGK